MRRDRPFIVSIRRAPPCPPDPSGPTLRAMGLATPCQEETARNSSRIKAGDFSPGAVSTPDDTSIAAAPDNSRASFTFLGLSPPARNHGLFMLWPRISLQSKARALPPGSLAPSGVLLSKRKR